MANIFFITGACGVGKTSIINSLKKRLINYEIHDFDDVGVPDNPPLSWRLETTLHWLKIGKNNLDKNKSTIICGLTIPQEIEKYMSDLNNKIFTFLLDVSKKERERRLRLREWVPNSNLKGKNIIDTTKLTIKEVAKKVKELILNNE